MTVMQDIPGLFTSFLAGLLSFLSPCVLPLIPVYLSFITGETAASLKSDDKNRSAVLIRTVAFSLGFTAVFVALAVIFGGGMKMLGSGADALINRIAGIIILILSANFVFDFIPFLRSEYRNTGTSSRAGASGEAGTSGASAAKAFLLGVSFAAGWTPCVGPILSSILLFAGRGGNVAGAALLLSSYSLGFALPFFLVGLFFGKALPVLGWFKKRMQLIKILSALLLFSFGIAMLTGGLSAIPAFLMKGGYVLADIAETGPVWIRPVAGLASKWLLFTGL